MPNSQKQGQLSAFVEREVLVNQTMLVVWLLNNGQFDDADIEHLYPPMVAESATCCECSQEHTAVDELGACADCQTSQEMYEWWLVSDWLGRQLEARGEPLLTNDYGIWWGRTCTGQAIYLDGVIEEIYDAIG